MICNNNSKHLTEELQYPVSSTVGRRVPADWALLTGFMFRGRGTKWHVLLFRTRAAQSIKKEIHLKQVETEEPVLRFFRCSSNPAAVLNTPRQTSSLEGSAEITEPFFKCMFKGNIYISLYLYLCMCGSVKTQPGCGSEYMAEGSRMVWWRYLKEEIVEAAPGVLGGGGGFR